MQNFIDAYSWVNIRFLLQGLGITIEISVASIICSFIIGTLLSGMPRLSTFRQLLVSLLT